MHDVYRQLREVRDSMRASFSAAASASFSAAATNTASTINTAATATGERSKILSLWTAAVNGSMKRIHPGTTVDPAAIETIMELMHDVRRRLLEVCDTLQEGRSVASATAAVMIVFGDCHISWHAVHKMSNMCRDRQPTSQLSFFEAAYRHSFADDDTEDDKFALAMVAALEHLSTDILKIAGRDAAHMMPRDLHLAIRNEAPDIGYHLFPNVCYANAGVVPNLHWRYHPDRTLGHVPFGLQLRHAVEECSLEAAQQEVAAGQVVDCLSAWRLARRAGIMYAEIHEIAREFTTLVERIVADVWSAADSVSGMQSAIAAHPLLGFLSIVPAAPAPTEDAANRAGEGGDGERTGVLTRLLDPIGHDAGLVRVGTVLKFEIQDFKFGEIYVQDEEPFSTIPCDEQQRLYSALRGPSKEALLELMTRLGLTFQHKLENVLNTMSEPQSISQFIFLHRDVLSDSVNSCLAGYAFKWDPSDPKHGRTTLLRNFSSTSIEPALYFAVGAAATLEFPHPTYTTSTTLFAVPDVARARILSAQRHEYDAILDPVRLRGEKVAEPIIKITV